MTILITGAAGFLGSYLVKFFCDKGYKVLGLKRSGSNLERIQEYVNVVHLYDSDRIDLSELFSRYKVDAVINTVTDYGRNNATIASVVATNIAYGVNLLEKALQANVKVFINTDTLLDRDINAYALSKAQFVEWMKYLSCDKTKMINIKIEHMYGPKDDKKKFIEWLLNQLKENVETIELTSGTQKRDFIYIDDVVRAYDVILSACDQCSRYEEFEIGSGKSIEVKEVVTMLFTQFQKLKKVETSLHFGAISYRKNEKMKMQANIQKVEALGWEPRIGLEEGIQRILQEETIK